MVGRGAEKLFPSPIPTHLHDVVVVAVNELGVCKIQAIQRLVGFNFVCAMYATISRTAFLLLAGVVANI